MDASPLDNLHINSLTYEGERYIIEKKKCFKKQISGFVCWNRESIVLIDLANFSHRGRLSLTRGKQKTTQGIFY